VSELHDHFEDPLGVLAQREVVRSFIVVDALSETRRVAFGTALRANGVDFRVEPATVPEIATRNNVSVYGLPPMKSLASGGIESGPERNVLVVVAKSNTGEA
jgi:hypothetical protein